MSKMVIIGTGAVATFLAERFSANDLEFCIYGGESARTRVLAQRFGSESVCTEASALPEHADWIVVTKTWQNRQKTTLLADAPRPNRVLVLQNGLEPELSWVRLAKEGVERGLSTYGARSKGPGRVLASAGGVIRLIAGSGFSLRFRQAQLKIEEVLNLESSVWHKLAVNASLNVVCTLFGIPNGGMLKNRQARNLTRLAAGEVRAVAKAMGVAWGQRTPWEIVCEVAGLTAVNICSTLADFQQGRPSEYEDINGAILDLAREHGLDTPILLELDRAYSSLLSSELRTEVVSSGVPKYVARLPLVGGSQGVRATA